MRYRAHAKQYGRLLASHSALARQLTGFEQKITGMSESISGRAAHCADCFRSQ
jgi:hypothetical protein